MRLLLDTHVAVWAVTEDERLSPEIRRLVADRSHRIFVSVVSLWEISIKYSLNRPGRDAMPMSATAALSDFNDAGFEDLAVSTGHAVAVDHLPKFHGDPFDRLLIAQALTEPLRLVTHDAIVARYSDTIIHF